jgi:tetratricopeptide (TPR) repeat protein
MGLGILHCMLIVLVTLSVYWQVGNHEFVDFDDDVYVTGNSHVVTGITGSNILWAFTSVEASNWHPITWLSHMTDAQVYGTNPSGHHFTNVGIHIGSTLLLFFLLFRLTDAVWQSAFVAAMFALHPLHVESVAWVAERKDVLSAFFWFLTLLFYTEYVIRQKPALYFCSFVSFLLGLMSKPMLVTLPVVMLLIDYWPLSRFGVKGHNQLLSPAMNLKALVKEKIPFYACSLFSAAITIYAQNKGGAVTDFETAPLGLRIGNALVAYVKYLIKTVWPHDLAVLYPFPTQIALWQILGALFILFLASWSAILGARRYPFITTGWFWFIVTLLPVIGLIKVGNQSMADRYHYLPSIGLFMMIAWGSTVLTRGVRHRQFILGSFFVAALSSAAVTTFFQLGYWSNSMSLYKHALQVTTANSLIHYNLGNLLTQKGDPDAAIKEYLAALAINRHNFKAHYNLANVFTDKGDLDAAIEEYQAALAINPNHFKAHNNLGRAFADKGDLNEAIKEFQKALDITPNDPVVRDNMAMALSLKKGF